MLKQLMFFQRSEQFISIYTDKIDTSRFIFGKILFVTSDHVLIYMIAPNGSYDGMVVKEIDSIIRLEVGDKYSEKMQRLGCTAHPLQTLLKGMDADNLVSLVAFSAKQHKKIVSIELLDSGNNDVVGFIEDIESGIFKVKQVDSYGAVDGYSFIYLNDITQIAVDSEDERIIERLIEHIGDSTVC